MSDISILIADSDDDSSYFLYEDLIDDGTGFLPHTALDQVFSGDARPHGPLGAPTA